MSEIDFNGDTKDIIVTKCFYPLVEPEYYENTNIGLWRPKLAFLKLVKKIRDLNVRCFIEDDEVFFKKNEDFISLLQKLFSCHFYSIYELRKRKHLDVHMWGHEEPTMISYCDFS